MDPAPAVSEPLASSGMLIPTLMSSEQELPKPVEAAPVVQAQANSPREMSKKLTKEEKEPIQIVRGGRVITLPPIEAPATRSKRLQAKAETQQKIPESVKKIEKLT